MSQRIPYLCGGTRGRDHFPFRRLTVNDPTVDSGPPGGTWATTFFPVAPGRDGTLKWIWLVKTWKINGTLSISFTVSDTLFGHTYHGAGTVLITATNVIAKVQDYDSGGSLIDADIERDLLCDYRTAFDPSGLFTGTLGNFGVGIPGSNGIVTPSPSFGTGTNSPFTQHTDNGAGLTCDISTTPDALGDNMAARPNGGSFQLDMSIQRINPFAYSAPPPVSAALWQMIWKTAVADSIRPEFEFDWNLDLNLSFGNASGSSSGGDSIQGLADTFDAGYSDSYPDVVVDGNNVPMKGQALHGGSSLVITSSSSSFTVAPNEYWPFKTKSGLPVYDTSSGAQLNDPFS